MRRRKMIQGGMNVNLKIKLTYLSTPKGQQVTLPCRTEPAPKEDSPARKPVSGVAYIQTPHLALDEGALRG